jgi:hypothetical protein
MQPLGWLDVNMAVNSESGEPMKVDVYKRPQPQGSFSYLAVPNGEPIPDEATNVDWETVSNDFDLDHDQEALSSMAIDNPQGQIAAKGYAISSLPKERTQPDH